MSSSLEAGIPRDCSVCLLQTMQLREVSDPGGRGHVTCPVCVALRRLKPEQRRSCSADNGVSSLELERQLPLRSSVPGLLDRLGE